MRLDFVLVRAIATLVVVVAVTLSGGWPAGSASPAASAAEMPVGATLKVLVAPVEVELAQTQTFVAAMDGQMLNQGDVVRTGPGGLALLTFFDGSESQLGAESTVQIERAEATPQPQIALLQTTGVTMNHVVPMQPGGSFQTDTPVATGLVRGTSYVVVVGEASATSVILLTDRDGHVGRVDVATGTAGLATSGGSGNSGSAAPLRLTRAGDAAGSDGTQLSAAHVAAARLEALEAGANARAVPDAARDAERHAHVVATALGGGKMDADGQEALEPAAAPERSDKFEDTGRSDRPKASEQLKVTLPSVPEAAVSATSPKTNSENQTGQSGQSGQAEGKSEKSEKSTVSAPAAPARVSSGDKRDKAAKPDKSDKQNKP